MLVSAMRKSKRKTSHTIFSQSKGFTLIEVVVVLSIIGLLATVAVPLYLGQHQKAEDGVAEATTRQAMEYAQSIYQSDGVFPDFSSSTIRTAANTYTGLTWSYTTNGTSSGNDNKEPIVITNVASDLQQIEICTYSPADSGGSGRYLCAFKNNTDPTPTTTQSFCRFSALPLNLTTPPLPDSNCPSW